jgi:cation diffusion facilitator CzcD-associated flavoprotein CzcO
VVIAGAGVAGLAAARALRQRGVEDFVLLDLEDAAGGNSRGGVLGGIACPLGAHYLPVPGDARARCRTCWRNWACASASTAAGSYDERHLCHSAAGAAVLPRASGRRPAAAGTASAPPRWRSTRFAQEVERVRGRRLPIPAAARDQAAALGRRDLRAWLDSAGLTDPQLRWYLDYCCRDDYGAGIATVSAWAGLHYFASRHGFHAPGGPRAASARPC